MADLVPSDRALRQEAEPAGRERAACWYCGRQDGEQCQKPYADVPCAERLGHLVKEARK